MKIKGVKGVKLRAAPPNPLQKKIPPLTFNHLSVKMRPLQLHLE